MKETQHIKKESKRSVSRKKMFRLFFSFIVSEISYFFAKKKKKVFLFLLILFLIMSILFVIYKSFQSVKNYSESSIIISESEIIKRVETLTTLPNEAPLSIVRVENSEILRSQNSFYADIKEGDYIIMYKEKAIVYDVRKNVIKKETK